MRNIERSILVLVQFNPNTKSGTSQNFPDVPQLRDKVLVTGVEVYESSVLLTAPNGQAVAASNDLSNVVITFSAGSDQRHQQQPALSYAPQFTNGIWREFTPFAPNLQRCFAQFTADAATISSFVIPVNVFYRSIP